MLSGGMTHQGHPDGKRQSQISALVRASSGDYRHAVLVITAVDGKTTNDLSNAPDGKDEGGRRVLALRGGHVVSTEDAEQNWTLLHRNQGAGLVSRPSPAPAVLCDLEQIS